MHCRVPPELYPHTREATVTDDPRALLDAFFSRPDRDEWTDAEAAGVFAEALEAVITEAEAWPKIGWDAAQTILGKITEVLKAQQPEPPKPPPPPNPCYWSGAVRVHVKPGCRCGRWPL